MDNETQQPKTPEETSDLRYLEPAKLSFFRSGATLRLTIAEEMSCLQTSVIRLFPLSEPQSYLSLRGGDNKELGVLMEPGELDAQSRALVMEELERRYLVPVVQRVVAVKERFGTVEWQVQTDRGPRTFTTRELRESVVQPSPGRYLLSDVDGNRYDVRDLQAMDPVSRRHLSQYL
jgi:hypothetical protein